VHCSGWGDRFALVIAQFFFYELVSDLVGKRVATGQLSQFFQAGGGTRSGRVTELVHFDGSSWLIVLVAELPVAADFRQHDLVAYPTTNVDRISTMATILLDSSQDL